MRKKLLAYMLAMSMVIGSVPASTVAAVEPSAESGTVAEDAAGEDASQDESQGTVESEGASQTVSAGEEENKPSETETPSSAESGTEPESVSEPETEASQESTPETGTDQESAPETGTNPESETESGSEDESGSETETESESESESESETETETETEVIYLNAEMVSDEPNPVIPFDVKGTDIFAGLRSDLDYSANVNASKYDPRTDARNEVTSVKDQSPYGTCWAFATLETIQSSMIRQGLATNSIDLSERQLAYFACNTGDDALRNADDDTISSTPWDTYLERGGNTIRAAIRLMNWQGAASERDYPYSGISSSNSLSRSDAQDTAAIVHDMYFIPTRNASTSERVTAVKKLISEYGSVAWSYYHWDGDLCFNKTYSAYYFPVSGYGTNHAITVVGWDDNFSASKFKAVSVKEEDGSSVSYRPKNNGAWIIKNSWGTGWGDGGYFYISYEDASLGCSNPATVSKAVPAGQYDNNYFYGNTSSYATGGYVNVYYFISGEKAAQIFRIKSGSAKENLQAVSMLLDGENVGYSIQVYKNPEMQGGVVTDPESGTPMLQSPLTGTTGYPGLYTVDLPKPISFNKDDYMSIVITFKNSAYLYFDASGSTSGEYSVTDKNVTRPGESLYYESGEWKDAHTVKSANFRINALTNNAKADTFTVRFFGMDGELLREEEVERGGNATPPPVPRSAENRRVYI